MKYLLNTALVLGTMVSVQAMALNENLISCSGNQGTIVDKCAVIEQDIIDKQSVESDFYVNYTMTCNRNYSGPKPSRITVKVNGGAGEINLNYNHSSGMIKVGTGMGPVTVSDSLPVELKNFRLNECSLKITEVNVELSGAEKAKIEAAKEAKRQSFVVFLENARQQESFNRSQILGQQSSLYFRTGQRQEMGCLIKTWSGDDIFAEVVTDLKNKFETSFGVYNQSDFDCQSRTYPELSMAGMTCKMFNADAISPFLGNQNLPQANRYFFETCLIELNYNQLLDWYKSSSSELQAKINEAQAEGLSDLSSSLADVKNDVDSIYNHACSASNCSVKSVAAETVAH